jgi:hypothetical protein
LRFDDRVVSPVAPDAKGRWHVDRAIGCNLSGGTLRMDGSITLNAGVGSGVSTGLAARSKPIRMVFGFLLSRRKQAL